MSILQAGRTRRRWPIVLASLILFEAGCSSMDTVTRRGQGSGHKSRPSRQPDSGTTIGTDPATIEPGRTIEPPSLGVDLSSASPTWESADRLETLAA